VVRVGYSDDSARDALELALGDLVDDQPAIDNHPTFGLASARVGIRRRPASMVYHGPHIRHRATGVTEGAQFLRALIDDNHMAPSSDDVELPLKVFIAGELAVLVDSDCKEFIDEFALKKQGINQAPILTANVDTRAATVRVGEARLAIIGIAVSTGQLVGDRDVLNSLVSIADGNTVPWAWTLDRLSDSVIVDDDLRRSIVTLIKAQNAR
jgi:hypothetical protein